MLGLEGKRKSPSARSRSAAKRLVQVYTEEAHHKRMGSSRHQRVRNITGLDSTCKHGVAEINALAAISMTAFSKQSWHQGVIYLLQHMIKHRMYGARPDLRVHNVLQLWKYNPAFQTFARHHMGVYESVVKPRIQHLAESSTGISALYYQMVTGFFVTAHNGGACGHKPVAEILLRSADPKNRWSLVQTYRYLSNLLYEVVAKNAATLEAMIGPEFAGMAKAVKWAERALVRSYRTSWIKQLFRL